MQSGIWCPRRGLRMGNTTRRLGRTIPVLATQRRAARGLEHLCRGLPVLARELREGLSEMMLQDLEERVAAASRVREMPSGAAGIETGRSARTSLIGRCTR